MAATMTSANPSNAVVVIGAEHQDDRLDFVGPSSAFKSLFSVPYATDRDVNVALHNLDGNTLLIEPEEDLTNTAKAQTISRKRYRPQSFATSITSDNVTQPTLQQQQPNPTSDALAIVTDMLHHQPFMSDMQHEEHDIDHPGEAAAPQQETSAISNPQLGIREYLPWKFKEMNMLVGSSAHVYRPSASVASDAQAVTVRVADATEMKNLAEQQRQMVQRPDWETDEQQMARLQAEKPSYAQAVRSDHVLEPSRQLMSQGSFSAPDLDQVQLQTCVVPSPNTPVGGFLASAAVAAAEDASPLHTARGSKSTGNRQPISSTPVCTVLDVYLDNIMANVPQLALCLREKGFVQSVKLMDTKDIPTHLMAPATLDTSTMLSKIDSSYVDPADRAFSPQIMEMNASTLLRFLKANCTCDNSTYLLRRQAGQTNIQLYDMSSISAQRQRKWKFWLAMMSYRFAVRLEHLCRHTRDVVRQRTFRARRRNLLENALQLLEDLADMDGGQHETLRAAVSENLADTFLHEDQDADERQFGAYQGAEQRQSPHHHATPPYATLSVDQLNKAEDHLNSGIKELWPLLERLSAVSERKSNKVTYDGDVLSDDDNDATDIEVIQQEIESVSMQLYGLHDKLINVSLRLAEHHLHNYWSSSAMQSLRSAARRIADAITLLLPIHTTDQRDLAHGEEEVRRRLKHQFTWLWEHCAHFARSFANDELWRERGHTCGDDLISLLRDVESAFCSFHDAVSSDADWLKFAIQPSPITTQTDNFVSLDSLSAVVLGNNKNYNATSTPGVESARAVLKKQKLIQREKRQVLVAACVCYSRAIGTIEQFLIAPERRQSNSNSTRAAAPGEPISMTESASPQILSVLRQRLGDACNEIGKILLGELRPLMAAVGAKTKGSTRDSAETVLASTLFWLTMGLEAFNECRDLQNVALVRCNLSQCCKLQANSTFAADRNSSGTHAESCLTRAADHLQKAHETLGDRETDMITWDMVSQELAATFLVLGVRRRQTLLGGGSIPVPLRLNPGLERSIIDPMTKALEIYEGMGNAHQTAAANYQLALFFAKVWTCQRDETKTREKLASAFRHYGAAHDYFSRAPVNDQPTFVILCLDLSSLYAAVGGEECLAKALDRCLDTTTSFSEDTVYDAFGLGPTDWFDKMLALASTVEERVFKLVQNLAKLEMGGVGGKSSKWKDVYRTALTAKMRMKQNGSSNDPALQLSQFHGLFEAIKSKRKQISSN